MVLLTDEQAEALEAFLAAFDDNVTGAWSGIEECMRADHGIDYPEEALEEARSALNERK